MKKNTFIFIFIFIFILIAFFANTIHAQTDCSEGRFKDSLFSVDVISNVIYGQNKTYLGVTQQLKMDIYLPHGDVATKRPLFIIAPGGSFLVESKADYPTTTLCEKFASMGYVTVGIDYRVGVNSPTSSEFTYAVMRATQDFRAAVRYFRKDASTTNTYKIDTSMIIAGGSSAGAISAIHLAYLDEISEILSTGIDTTGLGGVEGLSGNLGYSSKADYIVNLCGAIGDTSWIEHGDTPIISMHGTNDNIVPYGTSMLSVSGIPIMVVSGSSSITKRCNDIGVENQFYTFKGAGHTPYDVALNATSYLPYMDTTIAFIRDNLYNMVCESINKVTDITNSSFITISPNPCSFETIIKTKPNLNNATLTVYNSFGQNVKTINNISGQIFTFYRNSLASGIYFIQFTQCNKIITTNKLIIAN